MIPRLFCVLLLIVPSLASGQEQGGVLPEEEKALISGELQRYRTRFLSERQGREADENVDVTYYCLRLKVNTDPNGLEGVVTVRGRSLSEALSSVLLDLTDSLTVDSVFTATGPLAFTHTDGIVTITLDSVLGAGGEFGFDVAYHGFPPETGLGSFEFARIDGVPWISTLSEPYGARDWWPCKDHPLDKADSVDIVITCDSLFKVGSNGTLISVTNNGDGTSTTRWEERYPISTYLISLAIHPFAEFSNWFHYAPGDSMEILNYVLPDHLSSALATLPKTVGMLEVFSDMFGLYPFVEEKYGHAEFTFGGAMEHQTMTSTGTFNENTIAHEAAHQWFGDLITCRTWKDLWLNEGFATYATGLYREAVYGPVSFRNYMINQQLSARNAAGTLYLQDTTSIGNMFAGSRVYAKGACVLHMLRYVLGDSLFFAAMRAYADDPSLRYGTASTGDFQRNCETVSGRDLDWFFAQWVYGERYPVYKYAWKGEQADSVYRVDLRMVQETGTTNPSAFRMPMDVRFTTVGWDTTIAVIDSLGLQDFVFHLPVEPASVALDPDGWNLMRATLVSYLLLDVADDGQPPETPELLQNYPNPFNPVTTIGYTVPERSRVRLRVCNLLGEEIVVLYTGTRDAGRYTVEWDASSLPSGVYLSELVVEPSDGPDRSRNVRKMLLLR